MVTKRDITLCDDSNSAVSMTLWGKTAENLNAKEGQVIAFKGCKVSEYNGRSVSSMGSTQITENPDIPRAHDLVGWFSGGGSTQVQTISTGGGGGGARGATPQKVLAQIRSDDLGRGDKPDWFESRGTVSFIKHDATWHYVACPETKKKCVDNGDGTWTCEAVNKTYQNHEVMRRYILSITLNDHSGMQWFSAFDDVGQVLLGMSADELFKLKEANEDDFEKVFTQANFQEIRVTARAITRRTRMSLDSSALHNGSRSSVTARNRRNLSRISAS